MSKNAPDSKKTPARPKPANKSNELRKKAEAYLQNISPRHQEPQFADLAALLEELTIHQVELEMQGEELRQTTDNLRIAVDNYQSYFRHAPMPILRTNQLGKIQEFNLMAKDAFGCLSANSVTTFTNHFEKLLDWRSRDKWLRFHEAIARTAEPVKAEISLRAADGTDHLFGLTGQAVNPSENVVYLQDVTEVRRQKLDLHNFRSAVEQSPASVVITDQNARILFVNPAFSKITGYSQKEIIGQNTRVLKSGQQNDKFYRELWATLQQGKPWEGVFHNRHKDGSLFWELATIAPVLDSRGKINNYIAIKINITEQKNLQEQLEVALGEEGRQLRYIRDLTNALPVAILQKNREGHIIDVNPAAEKITGYSREEIISLDSLQWNAMSEGGPIRQEDDELLGGQKEFLQVERILTHKSGRKIPVLLTKAPIHDANDQIVGLVVACMDNTESKRLEKDLRKASKESDATNRTKSAFLATMSHEIRTPLNAVIGMASLLAESELNHEQKDYAHTIVTASETLLDLISDILDYSKIESQKLHLEARTFNFEDVFLEPLELFSREAAEKGIELTHWIDPQIPPDLVGDRARLKQILINLLGNAVKFTTAGQVSLTARLDEKTEKSCHLTFEVKDTGIGISAVAQKQLFQPFNQADSSITRQFGGSGLGLAISRQLVNLMGGDIQLDSEEGKGATFRFNVLLQMPSEELITRQAAEGLLGKRLLVIDDVAVNRKLVASFSHKWGIEVLEADGAEQARRIMAQNPKLDCIIFDYAMPVTDGATLAGEFARQPGFREIPRVLLSSIGDLTHDLPEKLFDRVLSKPIRPSRLLEVLSELLAPKSPPLPATDRESFPDLQVLLAEDNANNRAVLRLMLKKCRIEPAVTEDGAQALEAAGQKDYDVIILDVQMPVMDGLTAAKKLRGFYRDKPSRPFLIALTANAFKEDEIRCLEAGFDRYCPKPVTIDRLREVLAEGASRAAAP